MSAPQPRGGMVSRGGLIDAARSSGCRVVGVTAPAGYGKSTSLTEWASAEDRRVAWASLDRFDDDPAALLAVLASAYAEAVPGNAELVADMGGFGMSALGRAAPRLASVFRTSPDPFVFMLDDLHDVQSPACHDVLGVVISGIPRGSQLVAASRSEQPHLPRLRAAGDAWELGAGDLAFDSAGAAHIFSAARVELTPGMAATVTERTEGWPVGVFLASLIARDATGEALTISGEDRFVADYLYREALAPLPESTLRFLRRTAVLDQLSAPLCEAVAGEPRAQAQLRALEASSRSCSRWIAGGSGTATTPCSGSSCWVSCVARAQRHGQAAPASSRLVRSQRIPSPGVGASAEHHGAGPLCPPRHRADPSHLPARQQMSTVQRWLTTLGDTAIQAYPPLAVLAAWVAVLTGQTVDAQRWAAILDTSSFDLVPADGSASFESARAMLRSAMCVAGPDQAMADARLGVTQEQPWSPWRDQALYLLGEAHLLTGDVDQAAILFTEASAVSVTKANTDVLVLAESELTLLAMDRGRWTDAAENLARGRHHRSASRPRLRLECARLRRRRPAGRAPRRPKGGQSSAHLGDASPTDLGHPAAVSRRTGSVANRQGVLGSGRAGHCPSSVARDR